MSLAWRLAPRRAVLFYALSAALGPVASIHAQTTGLERFVGRDLWKDPLLKSEQSRLDRIVGEAPKGDMWDPIPWHVWKASRDGMARYIVLIGEPEVVIPGGSAACVLQFDASSKLINRWCFQTGWRGTLDTASFEFSTDLASDLIVLHLAPLTNGRNIAREYFAVVRAVFDSSEWKTTKARLFKMNTSSPIMKSASFRSRRLKTNGLDCLSRKTKLMCFLPFCSWEEGTWLKSSGISHPNQWRAGTSDCFGNLSAAHASKRSLRA